MSIVQVSEDLRGPPCSGHMTLIRLGIQGWYGGQERSFNRLGRYSGILALGCDLGHSAG